MATNDKYDRQLRLWGAHGQKLLSHAHVCLLGAGATGSETLKNLVLPGIGNFTIVDDVKVSSMDLENNFFVTKSSMDQPRAKVVMENLVEMNPDVKGNFVVSSPLDFMENAERKKKEFSLVVATLMPECMLTKIATRCKVMSVPLLIVRTYGLIGYLRVFTEELCVVESKPSPQPAEDIRIANPFPELESFVQKVNPETMDEKAYKHLPYVVVLIKLSEEWKRRNQGKLPSNSKEKEMFRQLIKDAARLPWGEEENLEEAMNYAYMAYGPRPIPQDVMAVINDSKVSGGIFKVTKDTKNFWILARALKLFLANTTISKGLLPLSGKLPDMTSTTDLYIQLQEIYQKKAAEDMRAISGFVDDILVNAGLDKEKVSMEERTRFCKNAYYLQVHKFRTLQEEYNVSSMNKDEMMMAVMEGVGDSGPQCPFVWYLALRSCDRFYELHNRYPGNSDNCNLQKDASEVGGLAKELMKEISFETALNIDHAAEMTRYGGKEFHNVAAVMGGIASQEAVKLLTEQYTPLNNTYIYNGITCAGAVYRL